MKTDTAGRCPAPRCRVCFYSNHSWAQEPAEGTRKVLVKTPPTHPTLAQSIDIRGVVKVEVQIAANGSVNAVQVKGGHPLLVQSAVTVVGSGSSSPLLTKPQRVIEVKFDQD